jgi:hypothetical protein
MRTTSLLFVLSLLLLSCEKDTQNAQQTSSEIWSARLISQKGMNQVGLKIYFGGPFVDFGLPPANPESFELYISDNLENFALYQKFDFEDFNSTGTIEVLLEGLNNDKAIYSYVSSHRKDFETVVSDTIMTIPSEGIRSSDWQFDLPYSVERTLFSYDTDYFAFTRDKDPNMAETNFHFMQRALMAPTSRPSQEKG